MKAFRVAMLSLSLLVLAMLPVRGEEASGIKPYPLSTCIVSGEDLDSMGEPVTLVYEGQEVKFCCSGCVKKFTAEPQKYLARMAEAAKEKAADAPAGAAPAE